MKNSKLAALKAISAKYSSGGEMTLRREKAQVALNRLATFTDVLGAAADRVAALPRLDKDSEELLVGHGSPRSGYSSSSGAE